MALTAKKVYAILKRQISDMEAKLNSPVRYRGTVATADLLPLNPDIGDMYNIESKSVYGEAGMNVAWNGVVWDTMGAPIDMSLYFTKEGADTIIQNMVNEYLEKNPVKPGATTEQAQQIEQNKTDIVSLKTETGSLKEDKADKTSLAQTDRKLDALWKLNQGISYKFEEDNTEAYQKTVPSGVKMASVKEIGGKTIVWNQLITNAGKISFSVKEEQKEGWLKTTNTTCRSEALLIKNHTYIGLLQTDCKNITVMNTAYGEVATGIFTCNNAQRYNKDYDLHVVSSGVNVGEYYFSYMLFDLTQMFAAGNEPSTVEEFEAMFPADYYPYNAGELMSSPVNEVMEQGKNLLDPETFEQNGVYNVTIGENLNWENIGKHANIPVKENTNYTVSFSDEVNHRFAVALADKNGIVTAGKYYSNSAKAQKYSILTPANTKTMYVSFLDNLEDGNLKVQVEESPSQTTYSPYHKTSHTIPSVVLGLDGYGDGIDDVCNYADWENKKYHKRIGRYVVTGDEQFHSNQTYIGDNSSNAYMSMDIGQKQSTDAKLISNKLLYSKWCWNEDLTYDAMCLNSTQIHIRILNSSLGITNEASAIEVQNAVKKYCKNLYESGDPIIIYYELAEEEITDISDIIDDTFQEPLEVESGGTLMFRNTNGDDYRIPVPSSEEYVISLAEVAK